jgi:hypothetical protein
MSAISEFHIVRIAGFLGKYRPRFNAAQMRPAPGSGPVSPAVVGIITDQAPRQEIHHHASPKDIPCL